MQRSVNVPLQARALAALVELAQREYREPRAQAAILIVDGLRRAGLVLEKGTGGLVATGEERLER